MIGLCTYKNIYITGYLFGCTIFKPIRRLTYLFWFISLLYEFSRQNFNLGSKSALSAQMKIENYLLILALRTL